MRDTFRKEKKKLPVALTIAGSDSGGGAGVQADLKTFAALKVHGTSAITCLTAQNPTRVSAIEPCTPQVLGKQIRAVFEGFPVDALKTGMLFSEELIRAIAATLKRLPHRPPLVVDPVMVSTSGARLLEESAVDALQRELFPLASLITPNLDEASILAKFDLREPEDLRRAARIIYNQSGCAVLIKGGHLKNISEAIDLFYDGSEEILLSAPYIRGISTHGTGCTYSAAIAAHLALGHSMPGAIRRAKDFVSEAIRASYRAGPHPVLNPFSRHRFSSSRRLERP